VGCLNYKSAPNFSSNGERGEHNLKRAFTFKSKAKWSEYVEITGSRPGKKGGGLPIDSEFGGPPHQWGGGGGGGGGRGGGVGEKRLSAESLETIWIQSWRGRRRRGRRQKESMTKTTGGAGRTGRNLAQDPIPGGIGNHTE